MLLSLQKHLQTQYWVEFLQNLLLSLLMDKMNTRSRGSWIQIGWENISNIRLHTMDMERNTMNGYSGTIYLRILGQNPSRTMNHSSIPNILLPSITRMKSGSGQKDKGPSRRDKKTYSGTQ